MSNLESFACLWLDQNVNLTQDNQDTLQELRRVINHLQIFDNSDKCEQCIRQTTREKVVLIVSGSLGRHIVPLLHDLPQLSACYVFCQDEKGNKQWADRYNKVRGVFVDRAKLVTQIAKDQTIRAEVEDGDFVSVISSGSQSLQARNASFMWFQLFIEVLLRMHHKPTDRKELLDICKKNYQGNDQEMQIIDEFEKEYEAEKAIWWYTRDSCFHRILNKALRVQNFDVLFALRFFITDIAKQLKDQYVQLVRTSDRRSVIRVYRGQMMGIGELELMKNSIGQYLSMNSFFSTSRDRSTALRFAHGVPEQQGGRRVIFEIEVRPHVQTKAVADIKASSNFQGENEVLIMLGALFHINKVAEDKKDRVWVVHLSLSSDDNDQLRSTFAYMKKMIVAQTNLDSVGKILHEMGQYESARKFYERMMHDLKTNTDSSQASAKKTKESSKCKALLITADCHMGLGKALASQKLPQALLHYDEAMKIRKETLGLEHQSVSEVYTFIGMLQWQLLRDYNGALISLKRAVEIGEETLPSNSLELATTYVNIGTTYDFLNNYRLASMYYHKSLAILEAELPLEHPTIAIVYNNLGMMHLDQNEYNEALEYLEKALDIANKTLPPQHPDIAQAEKNIARVKAKIRPHAKHNFHQTSDDAKRYLRMNTPPLLRRKH